MSYNYRGYLPSPTPLTFDDDSGTSPMYGNNQVQKSGSVERPTSKFLPSSFELNQSSHEGQLLIDICKLVLMLKFRPGLLKRQYLKI